MLKTPGSTPIDHPSKIEELKETAPEKPCHTENSQLTVKVDIGSNPIQQMEDPDPVKAAEPVKATEPVEAVEPVQTTEPVPTTPETACTTEVSHVEEENQEEHIPQSPPRSPELPQASNSLVTKLFFAFRPLTDEAPQPTPDYGLQL